MGNGCLLQGEITQDNQREAFEGLFLALKLLLKTFQASSNLPSCCENICCCRQDSTLQRSVLQLHRGQALVFNWFLLYLCHWFCERLVFNMSLCGLVSSVFVVKAFLKQIFSVKSEANPLLFYINAFPYFTAAGSAVAAVEHMCRRSKRSCLCRYICVNKYRIFLLKVLINIILYTFMYFFCTDQLLRWVCSFQCS